MRIEGVVLEHHGNVAVARRYGVDKPVADIDLARGDLFESGQHSQGSRLAASRGSHEDSQLTVVDREIQIVDDVIATVERLADVLESNAGHGDFAKRDLEPLPNRSERVPRPGNSVAESYSGIGTYSLTEPSVKPDTRYLLSMRNTMTTGILTRIAPGGVEPPLGRHTRLKALEPQRQRKHRLVLHDLGGDDIFAPGRHETEQGGNHQSRDGERQDHPKEGLPQRAAVDAGGLFEGGWDGVEGAVDVPALRRPRAPVVTLVTRKPVEPGRKNWKQTRAAGAPRLRVMEKL